MEETRICSSSIFTGMINVRTKRNIQIHFQAILREIRTTALSIEYDLYTTIIGCVWNKRDFVHIHRYPYLFMQDPLFILFDFNC